MARSAGEFRLVAKTLFGLEEVLAGELRALGAAGVERFNRMVTFRGGLRMLYKANLCCRTAVRILRRIRKFNVTDEGHLYDEIREIDWSEYLEPAGTLAVDSVVANSTFRHSLYVSQKVKDAIVDQFRERTGERPSVDLEDPTLRLNLHMNHNIVSLYLDSSGDSLHRRGYRTEADVAPINEVLAAGIILMSGWNGRSPFMDGMCGSGTFVIEAALLAKNTPPGIFRKGFGFERWKDYDAALYKETAREAQENELPRARCEILGSDASPQAVRMALKNVKNAGLSDDVRIERKSFSDQMPLKGRGVLVMNPPYGERMAAPQIHAMYRMIGDTLKAKYAGYKAWIFSGNLEALAATGLRAEKEITLFNGQIESRLVEYRSRKSKDKPDAAQGQGAGKRR